MNKHKGSTKFWFLSGLLLLLWQVSEAQQFGNEWINYNQQYIKIPVAQEGIYKISYQDLQAAGFPVNSINPRNLQLYHRGREQAIYVEGESNNIFDPADYVLFYGQRNDGTLDRELYLNPEDQPHAFYNLYSDTTAYFLTFSLTNQAGKRMSFFSENNTYNLSPEPYYFEEKLRLFTSEYSSGIVYPYAGENRTYQTYSDKGEGFTGVVVANGGSQDILFENLSQQLTTGPNPEVEVLLSGRNNIMRDIEVLAGANASALQTIHNAVFTGAITYKVTESLSWSQLNGGQSVLRIATSAGERVSVSYAKLRYARAWDMEGAYEKVFHLPAGTSNRRYIEVRNVPSNMVAYDITNPEQAVRIGLKRLNSTTVSAIIPNGEYERKILFSSVTVNASSIKRLTFRKINPAEHNYLIVSHPVLRTSVEGVPDPVKAYASYRASAAGGGFDTLLMNVGQLYDQFSYGEITPLAIRRLVTYIASAGDPEYLFLIGKGLDVYYNYYRNRNSWTNANHNLVPSFGFPGGDVPYTAQLNGSGYAPAFPVGRLGARSAREVLNYFNKVKEMEGQPVLNLSRKNLVHLSGGATKAQAEQFKRYLQDYEQIAEGKYLGGHVESISKDEDVVVQEIDITKEVNEGVGLVTFFGHSSPNFSDLEIGYVSDERSGYHNKGKYPSILVNGCDAGNIFSTSNPVTFGEDWIFTADKGAISFTAHSGTGYTNLLRYYSQMFYETAYNNLSFIDASIGKIQVETVRRFLDGIGTGGTAIAQAQQMVLQGDPAVKLFGRTLPDYETNTNHLSLSPVRNQPINLMADSIALAIVSRNFGRVHDDSLQVKVTYSLNGSMGTELGEKKFKSTYYQDTLYFTFGTNQLKGAGLYRFDVQLNAGMEIPEHNFTNNQASLEVVLNAGGTINLLPQEYGITPEPALSLYFQSSDPFRKDREYLLEVDTSLSFTSAALQQHRLSGDALMQYQLQLPEAASVNDTLVYYWRTKLGHAGAEEDTVWSQSSFTFLPGSAPGWSQSHSGQFRQNSLESLSVDDAREWAFDEISRQVEVLTFGALTPDADYTDAQLRIDEVDYILSSIGRSCRDNSINAVHFGRAGLEPRIALRSFVLDNESCGRLPQIINNFIEADVNYGNNDGFNLQKFLADIPEGDYVVLFSIGNINYGQWPTSLKEQLFNFGVDPLKFSGLTEGEPYIMLGQKGSSSGQAREVYADKSGATEDAPQEQAVRLEHTIMSRMQQGVVSTELIGPAAAWQELGCQVNLQEGDEYQLRLIGVTALMQEEVLLTTSTSGTLPLELDASRYPYVKLQLELKDSQHLTPPQLRNWQVLYTPLPEGVLIPAPELQTSNTFDEGQMFESKFNFVNISDKAFSDSVRVNYILFNSMQGRSSQQQARIAAPAPFDTTSFSFHINTDTRAGSNDLKVQVNPRTLPEMYYSNNLLDMKNLYTVRRDTLQPLVDVAFDGVYIANGAIVSPSPHITILLRDENRYKLKQDTTDVYIYLKRDCEGCEFERVSLGGANVRWQPASEQNDFKIEIDSEPLEDGIYTLQVQAADASGNRAGAEPYSISFEVITESTITKFYPYPNPFSTATRFVFTVTGSEVPDDIKIQIMTIDGRVVREILKEEIGPIRIGHNISEFAWDGKDEWGDQLANGVYLYKVYLKHSGDTFQNRETKGDKAFKQGFGKLYLLR